MRLPTPAIVVSSLAHLLILGLNFLKLTKSNIDFDTNNVEIGSKIHPADVHCITNSTFTITIPTSDIYGPCRLLLNKKDCWMVAIMLIIVIILTAVASHIHCHFKPPFLRNRTNPLFHLRVTLPGKNYWPTAPQSASRSGRNPQDPRRLVDYTSLTGHCHQSWWKDYTLPIALF